MAIQLSDRDSLIFRFIDEHQVLLEKHIAWFISCDEKPVLIRDRLRKLFYLDYLLCERHGGKLPWWTTPTKPLVYMLSPMTRQLQRAGDSNFDLSDCETQRHLLEVANLRMLFLMDQKEGLIGDCHWTTTKKTKIDDVLTDSCVTFKRNEKTQKIGIINHPTMTTESIIDVVTEATANAGCDAVWIISRDDNHQRQLQRALVSCAVASKIAFTTHQDIYKNGVTKAKWQSCSEQFAEVMPQAVVGWGSTAFVPVM
jgi:hypothetical protein